MPPQDLLLHVSCLVDDEMNALGGPPRRPGPRLADSEVITIEVVGELRGLADDAAILRHLRAYHLAEFPALAGVDRTRSARHAADLCRIKRAIQWRLAGRPGGPARTGWSTAARCRPPASGRAGYCRRFKGAAPTGSPRWPARRPTASACICASAPTGWSCPTGWLRPTRTSWGRPTSWLRRPRGWRRATATTGARRPARSSAPPGEPGGAVRAGEARPGADPVGAAAGGAAPDRGGLQPSDRAVRLSAGSGAGPVAPGAPASPQAPGADGGRLAQRPGRTAAVATRVAGRLVGQVDCPWP